MRDYAKVAPQFWLWARGKGLGSDDIVVALFLLSGPSSNMYGLYPLVPGSVAHYTRLSEEGASKGLRRLSEGAFFVADRERDLVWVKNMAGWQMLNDWEPLKTSDKRVKGANKFYSKAPKSPLLGLFYDKYASLLGLDSPRRGSPLQDPSKGLIIPAAPPSKPGAGTGAGTGAGVGREKPASMTQTHAAVQKGIERGWEHPKVPINMALKALLPFSDEEWDECGGETDRMAGKPGFGYFVACVQGRRAKRQKELGDMPGWVSETMNFGEDTGHG